MTSLYFWYKDQRCSKCKDSTDDKACLVDYRNTSHIEFKKKHWWSLKKSNVSVPSWHVWRVVCLDCIVTKSLEE